MTSICLIDTSIFLILLEVPNFTQDKAIVLQDFREYIDLGCTFLLPMATILETGNHIAQNGNGTMRRQAARRFVDTVKNSFQGTAPWSPTPFPNTTEILEWIDGFPDRAGQNKAPNKQEGTSFGDLSIIEEFNKLCIRFPMSEVFIWALDQDLKNYHQLSK
ncbi:MAG: hypothetical protein NW237_12010 [Cyanobacteriota bacterium]|nr:hypothetical protein [Cyanobacteriota bacterium]